MARVRGTTALQQDVTDNNLEFLKGLQQIKIKDFGINKLKQEMSVKEFLRQQEKFIYDDPVQRNAGVWNSLKRSLWIHSIIMGIPVPNVYVQMVNSKYNVIDGKQRLTTLKDFIDNKFPLDKETPSIRITDEEDNEHQYPIANYVFNALPEEFQDRIHAYTIVLEVLEMDDDIKNIVFARLNNNEPLKMIEKMAAYLDNETNQFIYMMTNNEFIQEAKLSANLRNRQGDREVIMQSLLFIDKDGETGIGSDEYQKWAIETGVTQKAKTGFVEAVQYLNEVVKHISHKNYKEALKKTHIPMLCLIAKDAHSKVNPEDFAKWVESFLITRYKNERYRDFASNKAASKENASARYRLMLKDFRKTFNLS